LSWIFAASRFKSMARICDARTPDTDTVDSVCAFFCASASACLPSLFFASDAGAGVVCVALDCGAGLSTCASANVEAPADVDTTAINDTVMANDNGCLRNTVDMGFDLVGVACRSSSAPWCCRNADSPAVPAKAHAVVMQFSCLPTLAT